MWNAVRLFNNESNGQIVRDLKKSILKKAAVFEKEFKDKNKKKYLGKIK